jgi:hypothetical protein
VVHLSCRCSYVFVGLLPVLFACGEQFTLDEELTVVTLGMKTLLPRAVGGLSLLPGFLSCFSLGPRFGPTNRAMLGRVSCKRFLNALAPKPLPS